MKFKISYVLVPFLFLTFMHMFITWGNVEEQKGRFFEVVGLTSLARDRRCECDVTLDAAVNLVYCRYQNGTIAIVNCTEYIGLMSPSTTTSFDPLKALSSSSEVWRNISNATTASRLFGAKSTMATDNVESGNKSITTTTMTEEDFIINAPNVCLPSNTPDNPRLLIVVPSLPLHEDRRRAIRKTWGNKERIEAVGARIVFLFGLPSSNDSHSLILEEESRLYGDIVQSSAFVDDYRNLTLKSMAMLRWTSTFCVGVDFLLKAHDDVFVRIDNLLSYVEVYKSSIKGKMFGVLMAEVYPSYLSGSAYVISGELIASLLAAADTTPLLPMEDVFLTGVLAEHIGAPRINHDSFSSKKRARDPCAYVSTEIPVISGHKVSAEEVLWLWDEINSVFKNKRKCNKNNVSENVKRRGSGL